VTLFLAGLALLVAASSGSVLLRRWPPVDRVCMTLLSAGCALSIVPAAQVLVTGVPRELHWESGVPGGDWVIGIDPLSAMFLVTVLGVGLANAAFGFAYLSPERARRRTWFSHATFAFVLAVLALVVTAQSAVLFLCVWELMSIGSYILIVTEHEHASVRRAGLLFLVVTHAGTLALFAMFAIWGRGSGDWTFAALAASRTQLVSGRAVAVFLLALFAFGGKAGVVPLHFWLPPAHAAAPSHVSALMSGVVIKTGIYGLLRVIVLAGDPPRWWGWVVLGLGVLSAVLGVLWALVQHDVKRLLAYHSVENIGIILMGMGIGALATSYGHPVVAAIGYAAAALHTLNHALFKSVLFLAAGAVYRATGTRNMEELGALARRMPLTWMGFFLGSAAIIGVPPLNGFVSEWLVYQGLFRSGESPDALRLAVLAAPALALVGGLALACFSKVAGVVFLGNARSARAEAAREPGAPMLAPIAGLALACVVIGALPAFVVRPVLGVGQFIAGASMQSADPAFVEVLAGAQRISFVAAGIVLIGALFWAMRFWASRGRSLRIEQTWTCGYAPQTARMQYTASSFAAPLVAVFGRLAGVEEQRGATVFRTAPADLVLDRLVLPVWARVQRLALRLRPMQQGRLHVYLLYVVATLLLLLAYLVVSPAPLGTG
jgi:formate hydrogenlyase subunit 3/multisubunit Na+/H+ antiporter MnhD subunit